MKHKIKYIANLFLIVVFAVSCEPRIDLDEGQWGIHADVSGSDLYQWKIENRILTEETQGAISVSVTEKSEIDVIQLVNTVTVKTDTDLTKLAISLFHNGSNIEPLDGAPTAGVVSDFSAKEFKYRVHSANGEYKDWTIKIVELP